jgi:hypothetical protein
MADAPRGELLEAVENQTRVLEKQSRIMGKLTQAITHSFGATEALKSSLMKVDGESSKRIKGLMSTFEKIPVSMEKSIKGFGTLLNMGLRNLDKSFLRAAGQIQALDLNLGSFSTVLRFNSNILRLNGRGQADMIQQLIKLRKTTGRSPEVIAEALGQLQPQVAKVAAFVGPDAAAGLQKALGATVGEFMGHEGAIAKMLDTFGGLTMESRGMRARIGLNPTGGIGQGNDLAEMGNILTAIHKMFASISDPAKAALLFEVMGMDHQMLLLAKTFIGAGGMASLRRAAGGGESSESTFDRALTKLSNATDALFKPLFNILTDSTLEFTKWLTTNMADLQPLVAGFANWAKDMIPLLFVSVIRALVWIGEGIGKLWNYFTNKDEMYLPDHRTQKFGENGMFEGGNVDYRTSFMQDLINVKDWALETYELTKAYFADMFDLAKTSSSDLAGQLVAAIKATYGSLFSGSQDVGPGFEKEGSISQAFTILGQNIVGALETTWTNFQGFMGSKFLQLGDVFRDALAGLVESMLPLLNKVLSYENAVRVVSRASHLIRGGDAGTEAEAVGITAQGNVARAGMGVAQFLEASSRFSNLYNVFKSEHSFFGVDSRPEGLESMGWGKKDESWDDWEARTGGQDGFPTFKGVSLNPYTNEVSGKPKSQYPVDTRLDMVKDGKDPYSFTPQQYEWERVWGPGGTFTQAVKEAVEEGVKAYQDAAKPSWVEDMVGRIEDPLAGIAAGLR